MTTNRWRVRHPGIGVLAYNNEAEARIAAGTAGEMLAPAPEAARCTSQNNCLTVLHHGDGRVTIAATESEQTIDATAKEWAERPAELGGPVPPDADLRALVEIAARVEFDADQEPERLVSWDQALEVVRQAYRDRVAASLAAVLPAHRAIVLGEAADAMPPAWSGAPGWLRRLAATTPPGRPGSSVEPEHAPPVSGQAPEAHRGAEAVGGDG